MSIQGKSQTPSAVFLLRECTYKSYHAKGGVPPQLSTTALRKCSVIQNKTARDHHAPAGRNADGSVPAMETHMESCSSEGVKPEPDSERDVSRRVHYLGSRAVRMSVVVFPVLGLAVLAVELGLRRLVVLSAAAVTKLASAAEASPRDVFADIAAPHPAALISVVTGVFLGQVGSARLAGGERARRTEVEAGAACAVGLEADRAFLDGCAAV